MSDIKLNNLLNENRINNYLSTLSLKITEENSEDFNETSIAQEEQSVDNPLKDFMKSLSAPKIGTKETFGTEISAQIIDIIEENKDFKTFRLKRPPEWNFLPGQYLEIKSEQSSTNKPAILAIASGISGEYIEITAKPNSNPGHPNYCLNSSIGDYLTLTGPLGSHFPTDQVSSDTPVLILGGGSGLTALKSVMNSLPTGTDMQLIYSSKTVQGLLYQEEIEKWKAEGHIVSLTQEQAEGFAQGHIVDHLVDQEIKPNTLVFICGPKDLVLETTQWLVDRGIPRESIYGSLPATAKDGGPVYRGDHPKMMISS